MKKTELKLRQALQLDQEIKSANIEKDLSFVVKFKLNLAGKELSKHLEAFEESRKNIIEKFGIESDKGKTLTGSKDEIKGFEELNKLLDTDVLVSLKKDLNIKDFKSLKTDKPYDLLFTLIQG